MYADFTDYQGTYCGTLITTQGQWMPAVREACAYLDSITFGRLKCGAPVDDTVKLAACALADVAARYQAAKADERSRPGLAAFNTDGYSETLNAELAYSIGIRTLLYKPINVQVLLNKVYELIEEGKADAGKYLD